MKKLSIIGGTVFLGMPVLSQAQEKSVKNSYGETDLFVSEQAIFIPRHGKNHNIPPHKVNHRANMQALKEMGAEYIIGVCSVGSLSSTLPPGRLVIPNDYINLYSQNTFFNDTIVHITPGLNEDLRARILCVCDTLGFDTEKRGVYFQTQGPRLETKAEIRMMSAFADIVGMTMAEEATAARELDLKYAAICSVDNYANGVLSTQVSETMIRQSAQSSSENIKRIITALLETL